MSYAIIGILGILAALKWGDWRHWKKYYSTVLYLLIADKVFDVLVVHKPFWLYGEVWGRYPIYDVSVAVLLYPPTVLLFFSFFPFGRSAWRAGGYMLLCAAIYTAAEWLAVLTGGFVYQNGWNLFCSAVFNLFLFPLLYLHYKKPLLVWPVSGACAFLFLFLLDVPFHH